MQVASLESSRGDIRNVAQCRYILAFGLLAFCPLMRLLLGNKLFDQVPILLHALPARECFLTAVYLPLVIGLYVAIYWVIWKIGGFRRSEVWLNDEKWSKTLLSGLLLGGALLIGSLVFIVVVSFLYSLFAHLFGHVPVVWKSDDRQLGVYRHEAADPTYFVSYNAAFGLFGGVACAFGLAMMTAGLMRAWPGIFSTGKGKWAAILLPAALESAPVISEEWRAAGWLFATLIATGAIVVFRRSTWQAMIALSFVLCGFGVLNVYFASISAGAPRG
jgi:hypothetical protein